MNLKKHHSLLILSILILTLMLSANAETSQLYVNPSVIDVKPGESFTVNISCNLNEPIEGYEFDLDFDPTFLQVNSVTKGTIFQNFTTWYNNGTIDNANGYINNVYSLITSEGNTSESGTLAVILFTALSKEGTTNIIVNDTGLSNDSGYISISLQHGQITIGDTDNNSNNQDNSDPSDPPSNTKPMLPEKPYGDQICLVNTTYLFSSRAIDNENDQLYYAFNWGDGELSETLGPFPSGTYCNASHEWVLPGIYNISVKAIDVHGKISNWSPQLTIVVQNI